MSLRIRNILLVVLLFGGLFSANMGVSYWLERTELVWGAEQEARGQAAVLAGYLGASGGTPDAAQLSRLKPQLARLASERKLSIALVHLGGKEPRLEALEAPAGVPVPSIPDASVQAILESAALAGQWLARRDQTSDLLQAWAVLPLPDPERGGGEASKIPPLALVAVAAEETKVRHGLHEHAVRSMIFGTLAIMAALVIAELLTRFTLRGLSRLERGAMALAKGDYETPWVASRVVEFNDLGNTFHTIAEVLKDGAVRNQRRFHQCELVAQDVAVTRDHAAHEDTQQLAGIDATLVEVRRVAGGDPRDTWGGRKDADGRCLLVLGRIHVAAHTSTHACLETALNACRMRDTVLAELHDKEGSVPAATAKAFASFEFRRLEAEGAGVRSTSQMRDALGTCSPDLMASVRASLVQTNDLPLAVAADRAARIAEAEGPCLILVFQHTPRKTP